MRNSRKISRPWPLVAAGWTLLAAGIPIDGGFSEEKEKPEGRDKRTGIIFETKAVDPEVFTRVEGARETVMVAVKEWDYGVKLFTAKEWRAKSYDNEVFRRNAEAVADQIMEKVEPQWVRDSRGVVLYALIRSDDPFLSSILLSGKFLPKFKKNLGESVRVLIIGRQLIYVFPDLGGRLEDFGKALVEQYQAVKQPVSLEVIRVSSKGIKVIGSLEE